MTVWHPTARPAPAPLPRRDRRALQVVGAIAALLLVGGLVVRGSVGLTRPPGERIVTVDPATGQVTSGAVELVQGSVRPLFPDVHLAPGRPVAACVELTHRGAVPLETVALRLDGLEGSSALLEHLRVHVERGPAGAAPDCNGFEATTTIVAGPLLELTTPPDPAGWPSWQPHGDERASYRVTVLLPADAPAADLQGARAGVDFLWAATAATGVDDLGERVTLLAVSFARDALLPLLLLGVLAVLFLGVQDRIDRQDPKLALASVHEEPHDFRRPGAAATHPTPEEVPL